MKVITHVKALRRALFRASVLTMVAAGAAFPLLAEEVSGDDAMIAVAGWVRVKAALGEDFTAQPASVREYTGQDGKGKFYVVSLAGGGFVVTSGDTELEPVIAYSKTGTWVDDVTQNPLLAMLPIDVAAAAAGLETASVQPQGGDAATQTGGRRLAAGETASVQQQGKAAKWAELMSAAKGGTRLQAGRITSNPGDVRVGKLLTTAWSQGHHSYPRVAYNYYTPTVDTDANYRFVCGCVATAGGQIMYYHQWPQSSITLLKNYTNNLYTAELGYQKPAGGAYEPWDGVPFGGTYDWNNMGATSSTANKQAIGKLLRDIGISVYMDYSTSGGASRISALYLRFTDQFGYANAACKYSPSEDEWKRGILASLDAKLPVAVSVPGHAIVADGYGYQGDTLYVHFNFGWEGSSDAWYNPPDLSQAGSNYTAIQTIIYNIYPQGTPNCTIVSGRMKDASDAVMANATVTALNRTSRECITATTDANGIYALFLPAGQYSIGMGDGSGSAVATNLTVAACVSTGFIRGDMYKESVGSYDGNLGSVEDIPGVELKLATIAVPVISPADGTSFYIGTRTVEIACADAAAEIRYTTDGSEPTSSSALYEGPFTVSSTTTVKAKAFLCGEWGGDTATATITKVPYYGDGGLYPNTPASHAKHWLDEREEMQELTGTWQDPFEYVDGKITFDGENVFTTLEPSKGVRTTIIMKVSFGSWNEDMNDGISNDKARAGVRVYKTGCFQAYTQVNGTRRWIDLTGVTPAHNTEYTVKLVLNTKRMNYTAAIVNGNTETPLVAADGGATRFAFANQDDAGIEKVRFNGEGKMESLEGSYKSDGTYLKFR